jgi:hypothetical protein
MILMSLTHVFFAEPGGAVVTVRLNDEPSGFETEPETWVEPNKCKLLCNRETVEWTWIGRKRVQFPICRQTIPVIKGFQNLR